MTIQPAHSKDRLLCQEALVRRSPFWTVPVRFLTRKPAAPSWLNVVIKTTRCWSGFRSNWRLTAQDRPFFAMEYVPGVALIQYCDDQKLSIPERITREQVVRFAFDRWLVSAPVFWRKSLWPSFLFQLRESR